jgi:hypothetical protein
MRLARTRLALAASVAAAAMGLLAPVKATRKGLEGNDLSAGNTWCYTAPNQQCCYDSNGDEYHGPGQTCMLNAVNGPPPIPEG